MGNTQKLGNYVNALFQDASNNIGIGAAPSGSYKLEVTGTAKVSSTLLVSGAATFGSTITASGNLNLQAGVTRNINFYDSSNTNINAQIQYDQIASNSGQLLFGTNNAGTFATRLTITNTGLVGINTTPSYLLDISDATVGTFNTIAQFRNTDYTAGNRSFIRVRAQSTIGGSSSAYFGCGQDGNTYVIANNSARGGDLIINASTGAATFSNTVFINPSAAGTAVGDLMIRTASTTAATTSQLAYDNARVRINTFYGSNIGLSIGYSGGNYNYLQSCYNEGTTAPMMLNPFGGVVVIGSNTPNGSQLQVNGTTSFLGNMDINSGMTMCAQSLGNVTTSWVSTNLTTLYVGFVFVYWANSVSGERNTAVITCNYYPSGITTISQSNNGGNGVQFQMSGSTLQIKTTSGTAAGVQLVYWKV
jgi:hypothetical protein